MTRITIDDAPTTTIDDERVAVWTQTVQIPTYPVGNPTPHPLYISKRVYQGSSGRVYPLAVTESVGDFPRDQDYEAVFLENRLIKVMVLPQIGGRIHMAYDKAREYHFVYFNRVIKPALVGLAGPWISGGIEFNWPQHHRPSTYAPVEYGVDEGEGEEVGVLLGEIDRMYGLRVGTRISLCPEDARIHIRSEVSNRTQLPQTFLWWANPAVSVNDKYQATFPPDVRAVFDHGKRDVSRFPIATGTYYKVDYSHGVDISRYRNIPVPTSYMAHYSRHDFVGGYDHGRRAGLLHVAANRYSPGKKQWTWGTSHFGQVWERNLTDQDGPYVELMTGIYTDNQPDFTWIQPGETKQFEQWFFPYAEMPSVLAANEHAALCLEREEDGTYLSVYTPVQAVLTPVVSVVSESPQDSGRVETGEPKGAAVAAASSDEMTSADAPVSRACHDLTLASLEVTPFGTQRWRVSQKLASPLTVTLLDSTGATVLRYDEREEEEVALPESATAPPTPEEVPSTEQLYLIGVHLEQNRHASWDPYQYYAEALRRDPYDARVNAALARRWIYRNQPVQAREHARRAVDRLCRWNNNPESGWAHYYLGVAALMTGDNAESKQALEKASWADDARPSAMYELAAQAVRSESEETAIQLLDEILLERPAFERALSLRQITLRRAGQHLRAGEERKRVLNRNRLAYIAAIEEAFFASKEPDWDYVWQNVLGASEDRFIDVLCEYAYPGCTAEVQSLCEAYERWLSRGVGSEPSIPQSKITASATPLPFYLAAHVSKDSSQTDRWLHRAEATTATLVFPLRLEVLRALEWAANRDPSNAQAHYLLGTAYYDRGIHESAYHHWNAAAQHISDNPTLYRNLALYLYDQAHRPEEAVTYLERATELAPTDGRLLLELDELYKRVRRTAEGRMKVLSNRLDVVKKRDDLIVRYAGVLTSIGQPKEAVALFEGRRFHPWEGGEGAVTGAYRRALIQSALRSWAGGEDAPREQSDSLRALADAKSYPENLGEGRLPNTADNEIDYWMGVILSAQGDDQGSRNAFARACEGENAPSLSMYYNDVPARSILYQGLARRRLGDEKGARSCFHRLRDHADRHEHDEVSPDYFAVSLPDFVVFDYDLTERNRLFCETLRGLGLLGLGDEAGARRELTAVIRIDPNNEDALDHLFLLEEPQLRKSLLE